MYRRSEDTPGAKKDIYEFLYCHIGLVFFCLLSIVLYFLSLSLSPPESHFLPRSCTLHIYVCTPPVRFTPPDSCVSVRARACMCLCAYIRRYLHYNSPDFIGLSRASHTSQFSRGLYIYIRTCERARLYILCIYMWNSRGCG